MCIVCTPGFLRRLAQTSVRPKALAAEAVQSSAGMGRRNVLQAGLAIGSATLAIGLPGTARSKDAATDGETLTRLQSSGSDPNRRILLKGGTVVTLDGANGNLPQGDVMIQGKRIAAVGPDLAASDAATIVVDATDMIVAPGFVDPHRHSWEAQLRGVIPDVLMGDYMAATHRGFAPFYRPRDMYIGNLLTSLGAIDAGITCIVDNCHNSRSSAHSDEAIRGLADAGIRGLADAGIRAVHASGAPTFGEWDRQWPGDLGRLRKTLFASDDQLLTLRIYEIGLVESNWKVARELDIWTTSEGFQPKNWVDLAAWDSAGAVSDRHCFNHMYGDISEPAWAVIKSAGIKVNICARSDTQYGLGAGLSGMQVTLDHGIRPGLSVDNESSYGTDMFTEMHVAYHLQRGLAWNAKMRGDPHPPAPLDVRDMLEFATIRGAECAALPHKIATLTPGKEADIIMVRSSDINTMPLTNAVATLVAYANAGNVDTVLIAGNVQKWRGKLTLGSFGGDQEKVRRMVEESRNYLFERRGMRVDPMGG